jgi:hypothetical protein
VTGVCLVLFLVLYGRYQWRCEQGPLGLGAYAMHRGRLGVVFWGPSSEGRVRLHFYRGGDRSG